MKKSFLIIALLFNILLSIPVFADEIADPGADPDPIVAAPIDSYVWVLAIVGLFIVLMKFREIQKNRIQI